MSSSSSAAATHHNNQPRIPIQTVFNFHTTKFYRRGNATSGNTDWKDIILEEVDRLKQEHDEETTTHQENGLENSSSVHKAGENTRSPLLNTQRLFSSTSQPWETAEIPQNDYFQVHPPCYNRSHGLIVPLRYKSGGDFLPPLPFVEKIRVCVNGFNVDTYLLKSGLLKMMKRLFQKAPKQKKNLEESSHAANPNRGLYYSCISYANHSEKVLLNPRDQFIWKIFEQLLSLLNPEKQEIHIGMIQSNGFKCHDLLYESVKHFKLQENAQNPESIWYNVNGENSRHATDPDDPRTSYETQSFMNNDTKFWYNCRVSQMEDVIELMDKCDRMKKHFSFLSHDIMSVKIVHKASSSGEIASDDAASHAHSPPRELLLMDLVRLHQSSDDATTNGASSKKSSQSIVPPSSSTQTPSTEFTHINMNLAILSKVLHDVSSHQHYVGFRDSSITKLLEPSLTHTNKHTGLCLLAVDIDTSVSLRIQTRETIHFGLNAVNVRETEIDRPQHAYLPQLSTHDRSAGSLPTVQTLNMQNGKKTFAFPPSRPGTSHVPGRRRKHKKKAVTVPRVKPVKEDEAKDTSGDEASDAASATESQTSADKVSHEQPTPILRRPQTVASGQKRRKRPNISFEGRKKEVSKSVPKTQKRNQKQLSESVDVGALAYSLPTSQDSEVAKDSSSTSEEPFVVSMKRPKSVQQYRNQQMLHSGKQQRTKSPSKSRSTQQKPSHPTASRNDQHIPSKRKKRVKNTKPNKETRQAMEKLKKLEKAHQALNLLAFRFDSIDTRTERLFEAEAIAKSQFSGMRHHQL